MLDALDPERVGPLLRGRFGAPYLYVQSCDSTQSLLDEGLPEGAVAVTEHQTAGRGRRGRTWEAPAGSAVLCSVVLRPPASPLLPQLALVGGLAVALAIERSTGYACQVKWPNDVLIAGRKIAGVLAEARGGYVALGLGINVNQTAPELPADTRAPAGSLRSIDGGRRDRAPLLADVLETLEDSYRAWVAGGLGALRQALDERDALKNRRVVLDGRPGRAIGIARDGRLEIDFGKERILVASGEITCVD